MMFIATWLKMEMPHTLLKINSEGGGVSSELTVSLQPSRPFRAILSSVISAVNGQVSVPYYLLAPQCQALHVCHKYPWQLDPQAWLLRHVQFLVSRPGWLVDQRLEWVGQGIFLLPQGFWQLLCDGDTGISSFQGVFYGLNRKHDHPGLPHGVPMSPCICSVKLHSRPPRGIPVSHYRHLWCWG